MYLVILLTLFTIVFSGISTIPFSIGLLALATVLFRKPWTFFLALGLGLFLDLNTISLLGYSSLVLIVFVLLLFLYERKFETRTTAFVFLSTFLGSILYLKVLGFQTIILQALINALIFVLLFKLVWLRSDRHLEIT
jgi:hypothetical protein